MRLLTALFIVLAAAGTALCMPHNVLWIKELVLRFEHLGYYGGGVIPGFQAFFDNDGVTNPPSMLVLRCICACWLIAVVWMFIEAIKKPTVPPPGAGKSDQPVPVPHTFVYNIVQAFLFAIAALTISTSIGFPLWLAKFNGYLLDRNRQAVVAAQTPFRWLWVAVYLFLFGLSVWWVEHDFRRCLVDPAVLAFSWSALEPLLFVNHLTASLTWDVMVVCGAMALFIVAYFGGSDSRNGRPSIGVPGFVVAVALTPLLIACAGSLFALALAVREFKLASSVESVSLSSSGVSSPDSVKKRN